MIALSIIGIIVLVVIMAAGIRYIIRNVTLKDVPNRYEYQTRLDEQGFPVEYVDDKQDKN
jgi:hypothetical protein